MKSFRTWWSVLPASALVLGACSEKKEKQEAAPSPAAKAVEAVKEAVGIQTPAVPALTPGERAAMLGIVGHLSKDTEGVLAIYDGKEIVKRLRSLKTWEFIRETAKEEGGTDPEEEIAADLEQAGKFIGQEMFIATGKGTAPQLENLVNLQHRVNYYQFRMLTQSFTAGAKTGDLSSMGGMDPEMLAAMGKDIAKEMELIDKLAIPPVLIGIKAADAETLGTAKEQLGGGLEMMAGQLGEGAQPVEFTKGGVAFKGSKLLGSFLAKQIGENREDLDQMLPPADVDKLIAAVAKKNIVIAYGTLENHLMLYLGDSEEGCPLVDKVEDSLAANEAISYVDGYKGKKIVGFVHADKGVSQAMISGSLKNMALGIRDGLAGSDVFGDTKDLATLLELIGEKEDALLSLVKADAGGGLAVLDEGVKFEFFGGVNRGSFDHSAKHRLSKLGGGEGVLMFGNWVTNPAYAKSANEYGEVIVRTAYNMAEKISGLPIEDEDFVQFKTGFGMFNEKFRTDTVGIWDALQTMESGLGQESAFVVDLKGAVPPIPSVPQELVDKGKFVRASMITSVTDRAKLAESWKKLDGSLRNILKTVSTESGQDIPMQKPMSSEKNGNATWFFSFPFFNDDFLPSVTVSDKWFVASTSKLQALDLVAAAESAGDERTGAWFELDFDALRTFTSDWVTLLEKDGQEMMGSNYEEFKTNLPRIQKGLAAFAEFDSMSVNERIEGGKLRTTLHFKVR
ncbi:hypothetical protein [Luteolibacter sp. Populi]|uniref:hypothetical protein n=1 Tax=Luteolibacter sp. Populi TaxID=3230487 RepID=UPI003466CD56